MEIQKFSALLSLLLLALSMSVSSAGGRQRMLIGKSPSISAEEFPMKTSQEEALVPHHRVLGVTTNDYENYEPTPSLSKPPFKVIPN